MFFSSRSDAYARLDQVLDVKNGGYLQYCKGCIVYFVIQLLSEPDEVWLARSKDNYLSYPGHYIKMHLDAF